MAKNATSNVRCGNCLSLDKNRKGTKGFTSGFHCKKGKGVRAPGACGWDDCFTLDPNAEPFHKHLDKE